MNLCRSCQGLLVLEMETCAYSPSIFHSLHSCFNSHQRTETWNNISRRLAPPTGYKVPHTPILPSLPSPLQLPCFSKERERDRTATHKDPFQFQFVCHCSWHNNFVMGLAVLCDYDCLMSTINSSYFPQRYATDLNPCEMAAKWIAVLNIELWYKMVAVFLSLHIFAHCLCCMYISEWSH